MTLSTCYWQTWHCTIHGTNTFAMLKLCSKHFHFHGRRPKIHPTLQCFVQTSAQRKPRKPKEYMDFPTHDGVRERLAHLSEQGRMEEAISLMNRMHAGEMSIGPEAYSCLIQGCDMSQPPHYIEQIYSHMKENGFQADVYTDTQIITLVLRFSGNLEIARQVFDKMPERTIVTWNIMIQAYAERQHYDEALKLFTQMSSYLPVLEVYVITSMLKCCAGLGFKGLILGMQFHSLSLKAGHCEDLFLRNAMLNMYAKCGTLDNAMKVIQETHDPDLMFCNSALEAYAVHGRIDIARQLFDKMPSRNIASWTMIITGYFRDGFLYEGLKLFKDMMATRIPFNQFFLKSVLSAAGSLKSLVTGRQLHCVVVKIGFERDSTAKSALIEMYSRCGCFKEAQEIFNVMDDKYVASWVSMIRMHAQQGNFMGSFRAFNDLPHKNELVWNTLIWICVQNRLWMHGLTLFHKMCTSGIFPLVDTVEAVLVACIRLVDMEQAKQMHSRIIICGYSQNTALARVLIHVYSNAGYIEFARALFESIEAKDTSCWNAVIQGCMKNGLAREALDYYEKMKMCGVVANNQSYVGALSACSQLGLVDQALQYFESFKNLEISSRVFACAVEILGRVGRVDEALELISHMESECAAEAWEALLRSSRASSDLELGIQAVHHLKELKPQSASIHAILLKVCKEKQMPEEADELRKFMEKERIVPDPAFSKIVVDHTDYMFLTGQIAHPQAKKIETQLKLLEKRMKEFGYKSQVNLLLHDVAEECEDNVGYHSEKLAMAFGLISIPSGSPIRVVKNHRVCPNCHDAAKFISKFYNRRVIITDTSCVHHFRNGICSCKDYW